MKPNIEDKVVIITGASSAIGEATALLLAQGGAKVVLGARRLDRLKALADRIAQMGAIARAIAFAIEQPSDVDVSELIIRPTAQT